ncbi:MAG: tetratricopeptide repeat protein [Bacteroidota bacterium]
MINFTIKKSGIIIILFFFIFAGYTAQGQNTAKLDSLLELAEDLIDIDDYKEAEDKIDEALDVNKTYEPAMEAKVRVLMSREKFSKANRKIKKALDEYPENPFFYYHKAEIAMEEEEYQEVLESVNKAQGLTKDDKKLLNKILVTKGAAYQKLGNTEKAMINYSKALEINSDNPNIFVYRGYLYYKKEQYKDAIEDFEKVLDLDPNNHYALYNIGMSEFKLGNKSEACDAFHKACELGNRNACQKVVSNCVRGRD